MLNQTPLAKLNKTLLAMQRRPRPSRPPRSFNCPSLLNHAPSPQQRRSRPEIEQRRRPGPSPVQQVISKRLSYRRLLTIPCAAMFNDLAVPSVIPMCVLPSGSTGRDPTDGANLDGAAPARDGPAATGLRMAGGARHSTTGTTIGGRPELERLTKSLAKPADSRMAHPKRPADIREGLTPGQEPRVAGAASARSACPCERPLLWRAPSPSPP